MSTAAKIDKQAGGDVFFVLSGLLNGEEGVKAQRSGPPDAPLLRDGWYYLRADDSDPGPGQGPFSSRDQAVRRLRLWHKRTQPGLKLLGHVFQPMTKDDWQGYAGAEEGTMIAHCEDGTTLLFDPNDNSITEVLDEAKATERDGSELSITPEGELERHWTFKVVR